MSRLFSRLAIVGVLIVVAGCGDAGSSGDSTPSALSTTSSTPAPSVPTPSTSAPSTPVPSTSEPSEPPTTTVPKGPTKSGLIDVADVVGALPELEGVSGEEDIGPLHVIGDRCGQVPTSGQYVGEKLPDAPRASSFFIGSTSGEPDNAFTGVFEAVVQFSSVDGADAVLQRYRAYVDNCAGPTHGGKWRGTVSSTEWRLPGLGDDAVGMLDEIDVYNVPSVQRSLVIRTGGTLIVLRVLADVPPEAVAVQQLAAKALERAGAS